MNEQDWMCRLLFCFHYTDMTDDRDALPLMYCRKSVWELMVNGVPQRLFHNAKTTMKTISFVHAYNMASVVVVP